jgi:hypothetical protein
MKTKSAKLGMTFSTRPLVKRVRSNASTLIIEFEDGRTLHAPLVWYPRLFRASQAQRNHWELIGPGGGVHWPDVEEDLSADGLIAGRPSIEYLRELRKGAKIEKLAA